MQLEAAKRVLERRKLREWVLASPINFSRYIGANPYDFRHQQVMRDPDSGFLPWCPYAEKAASYLTKLPLREDGSTISKPIYPVFIGRDHHKTTIAEVVMAYEVIKNPNKSYWILCDTEDKAQERLAHIKSILVNPKIQDLFANIVYPESKEYYTQGAICVQRAGKGMNAMLPAITAAGIMASTSGKHFNGIIWMDDIVTNKNYRQSEVQMQLWIQMQQVMSYVASPGCHLWVTGTRYHLADAYRNILDHDSPIKGDIVPGHIVWGCTESDGMGGTRPLNFMRFCMDADDTTRPVRYRGVRFENMVRESLLVKKQNTRPVSEWYAQMENNPTSEDNAFFRAEDFQNDINTGGMNLVSWIGSAEAQAILGEVHGPLQIAVLGDPAYGGSDSAVVLVVGCDREGRLYLMNGHASPTKDLRGYFMRALTWRDEYGCTKDLGIEVHAKESSKTLCEEVARGMRVAPPRFFKLTDNSSKSKEARIQTLASYVTGKKLWFCNDFPMDVRRRLQDEAMTFPNGQHDDIIDTLANATQVFDVRRGLGKPTCLMAASRLAPRGVRRFLR